MKIRGHERHCYKGGGFEYGKNLLCHVGLASMLNRLVVLGVPPGMGSLIQERSVGL